MKRPKKAKPTKDAAKPDEPATVVCSAVSRQPIAPVPGVQALCAKCRTPVWFSYSSAVALGSQPYECVCMDCAFEQMKEAKARGEPMEFSPPTALQRAEIARVLGRDVLGENLFTDS